MQEQAQKLKKRQVSLHITRLALLLLGGITLHRAPLDLVSLAQEALMVAKERMEKRRTTSAQLPRFRFRLKNALTGDEAILQADRSLVREALDQLLENAIQYSPEGGQIRASFWQKYALQRAQSDHSRSPASHKTLTKGCLL